MTRKLNEPYVKQNKTKKCLKNADLILPPILSYSKYSVEYYFF